MFDGRLYQTELAETIAAAQREGRVAVQEGEKCCCKGTYLCY
jgi:hypothetical protein